MADQTMTKNLKASSTKRPSLELKRLRGMSLGSLSVSSFSSRGHSSSSSSRDAEFTDNPMRAMDSKTLLKMKAMIAASESYNGSPQGNKKCGPFKKALSAIHFFKCV